MNNDRGLLSGSITILIGAVIAIMALVRGPWQVWLLLGIFTLWGLWVVLILLLPYMQQAKRHRQRQQRTRQLYAEGIQTRNFEIPDLGSTSSDDLLVRHTNHRILAYLRSAYPQATFEWCEKQPEHLIRNGGTGRIRVFGIDEFDHADVTLDQNANIKCDMVKIVPLDWNSLLPIHPPVISGIIVCGLDLKDRCGAIRQFHKVVHISQHPRILWVLEHLFDLVDPISGFPLEYLCYQRLQQMPHFHGNPVALIIFH